MFNKNTCISDNDIKMLLKRFIKKIILFLSNEIKKISYLLNTIKKRKNNNNNPVFIYLRFRLSTVLIRLRFHFKLCGCISLPCKKSNIL